MMKTINKFDNCKTITIQSSDFSYKNSVKSLIDVFSEQALNGTVLWNKNVFNSIQGALKAIDDKISSQLSEIMHHESFSSLESSWRGLFNLVKESRPSSNLKVKVLDLSKKELSTDLSKASDFDQSHLFKIIYEREYGTAGGEPYGALLGDYYFDHSASDVDTLQKISQISATSFSPFLTAPSPQIFGLDSFSDLNKPRNLERIFSNNDYIKWNNLRSMDDARFLVMCLPRVLARLPYGSERSDTQSFNFIETPKFCWINAAYALAGRMTHSFNQTQWCTAIRGAESGGKVKNLPLYSFTSLDGDREILCPTEINITDRREIELSQLGFLPLCHYKNSDFAVFFGSQTLQNPPRYTDAEANANAAISARLPYIMASSRFAHYLKILARDKIGSFTNSSELANFLNRWILNYVNANPDSGDIMKAKYPLSEAKITVSPTPGKPGSYHAVAWLKPWLQLEELTASLRLVADIPKKLMN